MSSDLQIRPFEPSDKNFVYNSWLKSYRQYMRPVDDQVYYSQESVLIDKSETVLILCIDSDPDIIIGYLAYSLLLDVPVIHYLYVKEQYRSQGCSKALLNCIISEHSLFIYDHWTKYTGNYKSYTKGIYNPYLRSI